MVDIDKKINTVLLVDDDDATLLINKMMLKKAGLENTSVDVAFHGGEAIEHLKKAYEADDMQLPDIIFLDINMPAVDGWDFLEEYEQLPYLLKENIKIVMLSTSLNPDDEARARNTPAINKFLRKPLMPINIQDIVAEFFNHNGSNELN